MKVTTSLSLLAIFALFFTLSQICKATCVFESDFGFVINCAFKKSSLFRIRNLGGVKAHISWGLSVGDDLRFNESILNTGLNKIRSTSLSKEQIQLITAQQEIQNQAASGFQPSENYLHVTDTFSAINSSQEVINYPLSTKTIKPVAPIPTLKQIFSPPMTSNATSSEAFPRENETTNSKGKEPNNNGKRDTLSSSQQIVSASNEILPNSIENINFNIINSAKKPEMDTRTSATRDSIRSRSNKVQDEPSNITAVSREYNPSGYGKTVEVSVSNRIKLPKTSFECRHQRYFPGLYADEDLGCSVFHVCVMMEHGELISRSFLCPELTLFDQSILKCNWWLDVDCSKSKVQYDVNMPVASSYQVMKEFSSPASRKRSEETIEYNNSEHSTAITNKKVR